MSVELKPLLLAFLPLVSIASIATDESMLDVITLQAQSAPTPQHHLGWECESLLRSDFSLHRGSSCQDDSDETRQANDQRVELPTAHPH